MKKGDVIRQKCVNTTFYLTGILAHKVNNCYPLTCSRLSTRIQTFLTKQETRSARFVLHEKPSLAGPCAA